MGFFLRASSKGEAGDIWWKQRAALLDTIDTNQILGPLSATKFHFNAGWIKSDGFFFLFFKIKNSDF